MHNYQMHTESITSVHVCLLDGIELYRVINFHVFLLKRVIVFICKCVSPNQRIFSFYPLTVCQRVHLRVLFRACLYTVTIVMISFGMLFPQRSG